MEFRFCPRCGRELVGEYVRGKSYPSCPEGHFGYFPTQSVGVAGVIHHEGRILLERRAIEPGYGLWALPGGMAEPGEGMEECLRREALEEAGLEVEVGRLLAARGGLRVAAIFYEATVVGGSLACSDESLEVRWFGLKELPLAQFAFPRHRAVLEEWLANQPSDV